MSPEQIACDSAGTQLYIELDSKDFDLNGVGVGQSEDGNPAIVIYLLSGKHKDLVPDSYQGYKVITKVTGPIVACN